MADTKISALGSATTPLAGTEVTVLVQSGGDVKITMLDLASQLKLLNTTKVYRALLTQAGTNPPVATVLENTLGGTPVWAYVGAGDYSITLAGAFPAAKTLFFTTLNWNAPGGDFPVGKILNNGAPHSLDLVVGDNLTPFLDDVLSNTPIEILVFP